MSGFERMFLFWLWGWGGAAAPRSLIAFALTSRIASFISAMLSARCFFSPSSAFLARTCSPRCVRDGASHARRSSRLACSNRAFLRLHRCGCSGVTSSRLCRSSGSARDCTRCPGRALGLCRLDKAVHRQRDLSGVTWFGRLTTGYS